MTMRAKWKRAKANSKAQARGRSLHPVVRQLIKAYDDYLALLKMEADSMISVAFVHGWRSCFVEEGKAHRAKIEELKFALDYEKQDRLAKFAQECRRNAGLGDSQPNPSRQPPAP